MTKQEQIGEMAKVIDKTIRNECVLKKGGCTDCNFLGKDTDEYECQSLLLSTLLYNAGYGKVSEYEAEIERLYRRIAELEQDLVHADENVFYREQNVVLHEETIKSEVRKETAKEIISFIESKDKKCGKYSIYTKLLQELKEKYLEVEE